MMIFLFLFLFFEKNYIFNVFNIYLYIFVFMFLESNGSCNHTHMSNSQSIAWNCNDRAVYIGPMHIWYGNILLDHLD